MLQCWAVKRWHAAGCVALRSRHLAAETGFVFSMFCAKRRRGQTSLIVLKLRVGILAFSAGAVGHSQGKQPRTVAESCVSEGADVVKEVPLWQESASLRPIAPKTPPKAPQGCQGRISFPILKGRAQACHPAFARQGQPTFSEGVIQA